MRTVPIPFLLLAVLASTWTRAAHAADDIRSKVLFPTGVPASSRTLDPDKEVYGVPFGASEDDLIKAHGKPMGYVRLNDQETVLIYGSSHGFLFEGGKLVGLRITHNLLDWKLTRGLSQPGPFEANAWRLTNGLRPEMSRSDVKRILGTQLRNDTPYQFYYRTDKAQVEIDFSHYTQEGDDDNAYRIHSIFIRQGVPEASPKTSTLRLASVVNQKTAAPLAPLPEDAGLIGIRLGTGDGEGLLEVLQVTKDGPAEKAGVRPGSLIVSVDGTTTDGKSLQEVTRLIRGNSGTKVTLELWNLQSDKTNKVTLTRESTQPPKPAADK